MKNKKAFTLIELVSVLVILAILALIVTPLVLNIIRKARNAADKRSIDAYGRSIELAVADYLLENGTFPTSIDELTIEYNGDRVVCETTKLSSDTSVYLSGCTVNSRIVDYVYGKENPITYKSYSIGDEVTYNDVDYYVIKNSNEKEDTVTLLKDKPLTSEEITTYSAGTGASTNISGTYGTIQYGSTTDYAESYVKTIVDIWSETKVPRGLTEARLITVDELKSLNYGEEQSCGGGCYYINVNENVATWVYNSDYSYWTMDILDIRTNSMWIVSLSGSVSPLSISYQGVVRPVIVLSKSVLN